MELYKTLGVYANRQQLCIKETIYLVLVKNTMKQFAKRASLEASKTSFRHPVPVSASYA